MRQTTIAIAALLLSNGAACANTDKAGTAKSPTETHLTLATRTKGAGPGTAFAREVERVSGGSIRVDITSTSHRDLGRGSDSAILADVRSGVVDLGVVSVEALQKAGVRSFDAFVAPGVVTSIAAEAAVTQTSVGSEMLDGVTNAGVVGISIAPGPIHRLAIIDAPITDLSELKGQPFLVTGTSQQAVKAVSDLNAAVVLDDRADTLKRDVRALDASPSLIGQRGAESLHGTLFGNLVLWPQPAVIVVRRETLDRLQPAQRDLLRRAGTSAAAIQAAEQTTVEQEATTQLCRLPSWTITDASGRLAEELQTHLDAETAGIRDAHGTPTVDQVKEIVKTVSPRAALVCLDHATATPANGTSALPASASALVGTWRANATQANLDRAGIPGNEFGTVGINTLRFTPDARLVVDFPDGSTTRGSVTAAGDTITVKIDADVTTDMGGGEVWRYTWSVFGDTLTLVRALDNGITYGPTSLISQPFTRTS